MTILTFVVIIIMALGFFYVGALAFGKSFVYLALVFQRFAFFLVQNAKTIALFPCGMIKNITCRFRSAVVKITARLVQAVIKKRSTKTGKVKVSVEPKVTYAHVFAEKQPDWSHYDKPAYLRKRDVVVW